MAARSWWEGRRRFLALVVVVNGITLVVFSVVFAVVFGMGTPHGWARTFQDPRALSTLVLVWMGGAAFIAAIAALIVFLLGWSDAKLTSRLRLIPFARRVAWWQFLAHLILAALGMAWFIWEGQEYSHTPII